MSTQPPLTPEQIAAVQEIVNDDKVALVKAVTEAVKGQQENVIADAKKQLEEAVDKNYRVMLTTVKDSDDGGKSKWPGRMWEFLKLIIPVAATAYLGYMVSGWQLATQQKIDDSTKTLEAKLSQKGEYFEKKLAAYHDLNKQIAGVQASVLEGMVNPASKKKAGELLGEFNKSVDADRVYIPKATVYIALKDMWRSGTQALAGQAKVPEFKAKVTAAVDALRDDLGIEKLNTLEPEVAEKK